MVNLRGFAVLGTLAAVACAVLIAACGASGGSVAAASGGPSPAHVAAGIKFAGCMRSHGIPNFPDPSGGGGIQIPAGSGINPFSPAFKAAQASCQKLMPGGGPGAQRPSEHNELQMLRLSQCMRRHGVSGFPDPTLKLPSNPNPAEYSILEDRGGVVLAVPSTIHPSSPVFEKASAACGFD
jgi:hypothetical protein